MVTLWYVRWGYGVLVTLAETKEEAKSKLLKEYPDLSESERMGQKETYIPINEIQQMTDEVEYFGE